MYRSSSKQVLKLAMVVMLLAAVGTSSGCLWAPELARVRRDIEDQIPGASFDKEIELSLGPVSLMFARLVVNVVPAAEEARGYLRDVRRVQVAVYNTEDLPETRHVTTPKRLKKLIDEEGWEMGVKIRDEDEMLWILYYIDGETIKEMYVVALNEEELVLVKVGGRLERLVAHALSESGSIKDVSTWEDPF